MYERINFNGILRLLYYAKMPINTVFSYLFILQQIIQKTLFY